MKNQYVGDINDYKKFGLLRSILTVSNLNILVSWMLTPDDGSTDGNIIGYLEDQEQWSGYDPQLYQAIKTLLNNNKTREVNLIETSNILEQCDFYSNHVPDSRSERDAWFNELLHRSNDNELIFLDPDNGLEIKSKRYGRKDSSKFLFHHEVSTLLERGKSLLIYQHFIREKREVFISRLLKKLQELSQKTVIVEAFSTSNVVFLLVLQPEHESIYKLLIEQVEKQWNGQISVWSSKENLTESTI